MRENLPKDVDEEDFAEAKACAVSIVPINDSELMLDGYTYPMREDLKKLGFEYKIDYVPGVDRWVGPSAKIDTAEVGALRGVGLGRHRLHPRDRRRVSERTTLRQGVGHAQKAKHARARGCSK